MKKIQALLVDDHAVFRESVARVLTSGPEFTVTPCATIREALQILAQKPVDLVLLDHDLGSERASQFLPAARQIGFNGRVLIVTAWVSDTCEPRIEASRGEPRRNPSGARYSSKSRIR